MCAEIAGMIVLAGRKFLMGSKRHYPEAPPHRVRVDAFRIDPTPVMNRQFTDFVAATGYTTVAELRSIPPAIAIWHSRAPPPGTDRVQSA